MRNLLKKKVLIFIICLSIYNHLALANASVGIDERFFGDYQLFEGDSDRCPYILEVIPSQNKHGVTFMSRPNASEYSYDLFRKISSAIDITNTTLKQKDNHLKLVYHNHRYHSDATESTGVLEESTTIHIDTQSGVLEYVHKDSNTVSFIEATLHNLKARFTQPRHWALTGPIRAENFNYNKNCFYRKINVDKNLKGEPDRL